MWQRYSLYLQAYNRPSVKNNNPLLGTQKTVSLDFVEESACEGCQRNFKISQPIIYLMSPSLHGWNIADLA